MVLLSKPLPIIRKVLNDDRSNFFQVELESIFRVQHFLQLWRQTTLDDVDDDDNDDHDNHDDHDDHDNHDDATRKTAKRRVAGGQYSKLLVSYITIVMPVPRIGV